MGISLIALDMDGVIFPSGPDADRDPCIKNLNKLIKDTNSKILLTSTWRLDFKGNVEKADKWLKSLGIEGDCIGMTEYLQIHRGLEIIEWLSYHDIDHLVILDDDNDMDELMPYLVNTKTNIGLTEKHIEEAKGILKRCL